MEKDYKEKYNNLKDAPETAYEMEDEDVVVVLTNEDGEETYYREETIITVGDDRFAVLVGLALDPDGEETEGLPEALRSKDRRRGRRGCLCRSFGRGV